MYQNNNAYLMTGTFILSFKLMKYCMVIGGDMLLFLVSSCNVLYFDSHYHVYIISVSSCQSLISDLFDYNVYHGHKLTDDLTYIYLKHYVM